MAYVRILSSKFRPAQIRCAKAPKGGQQGAADETRGRCPRCHPAVFFLNEMPNPRSVLQIINPIGRYGMKKVLSVAAIALMVAGSAAFAGEKCSACPAEKKAECSAKKSDCSACPAEKKAECAAKKAECAKK